MAAQRSRALVPLPTTHDENERPGVKRRRTKNTRVACYACQRRKSACDGDRPVCHQCAAREIECLYETLDPNESRSEALKREFDELKLENCELKHSNYDLAYQKDQLQQQNGELNLKLQQLQRALEERMPPQGRDGPKSKQARLLTNGVPGPQSVPPRLGAARLSDHANARAILPLTSSRLEYEVQVSHPGVYQMLPDMSVPSNSNVIFQPELGINAPTQLPQSSIMGPISASRYPDDRLASLRMSFWSKVPIPDETARRVLALYLVSDHAISSLFDPDLFLNDLVGNGVDYCSPILVSALMFWACQAYSLQDPSVQQYIRPFEDEAMRYLQANRTDSYLTAAALLYLCTGSTCSGNDESSAKYFAAGESMATTLQLINHAPGGKPVSSDNPTLHRAKAHTAWGIFCWLMIRASGFRTGVPIYPPVYPIPDPEKLDASGSRFQSRYMGNTFRELCKLLRLFHELTLFYYTGPTADVDLRERVPLAFAEATYRKILCWSVSANRMFAGGERRPHHVDILHIYYHTLVLDTFRPFAGQKLHLRTFQYGESTADDIVTSSLNQLKRRLITYPRTHPTAPHSIWWHPACLYVANAILASPSDADFRQYFALCLDAYQKLSRCFRVARTILQGLLAMAVQKGVITVAQARAVQDKIADVPTFNTITTPQISRLRIDLELAMKGPQVRAAEMAVLVNEFEEKLVLDEFVDFDGQAV